MNIQYILTIVLCIAAIILLMMTIGVVMKTEYPVMKWVVAVLCAFTMTRYLTLIVYGDHPSLGQLEALRYFYLASSIGLTMSMASAIWYITPYLRDRIQYLKYMLFFLPWIVFYIALIFVQPTTIEQGKSYGYTLVLNGKWPIVLSIAQASFVVIILVLCLVGLVKYKHTQLRSQYFVFILALVALVIDGLSYFLPFPMILPPFLLSEIFGFCAVYYAYRQKPLKIKK